MKTPLAGALPKLTGSRRHQNSEKVSLYLCFFFKMTLLHLQHNFAAASENVAELTLLLKEDVLAVRILLAGILQCIIYHVKFSVEY